MTMLTADIPASGRLELDLPEFAGARVVIRIEASPPESADSPVPNPVTSLLARPEEEVWNDL